MCGGYVTARLLLYMFVILHVSLSDLSFGLTMTTPETQGSSEQNAKKTEYVFQGQDGRNLSWPFRDREASINGDIIIGGLVEVHAGDDKMICGKVRPRGGLQVVEALMYTVDWVNRQPSILPGIALGVRVRDNCPGDAYGLEQTVDSFASSRCRLQRSNEVDCKEEFKLKPVIGVVGTASTGTTIRLSNLLKPHHIPQISSFSTFGGLSDEPHPYTLRTIPSDKQQAAAIVALVKYFGWSYVSVVYEDNMKEELSFEAVRELLTEAGICIAGISRLLRESRDAVRNQYEKVVWDLLRYPKARGVILLASDHQVAGLMRTVRRLNVTRTFSWIGGSGWAGSSMVSAYNEQELEGAVAVQAYATPVSGFENYFLNLHLQSNKHNPWFVEFWEDYFSCRIQNSIDTPTNRIYKMPCNESERMTRENGYRPEPTLQFVIEAFLSFAFALENMHRDYCRGEPGLCAEMKPHDGPLLLQYLRNVTFTGLSGEKFRFLPNGGVPAKYRVFNFRQKPKGNYAWTSVGVLDEGGLKINSGEMQYRLDQHNPPDSACSKPCRSDQAKAYSNGVKCCWVCVPCSDSQYVSASGDACMDCPAGSRPNRKLRRCVQGLRKQYMTISASDTEQLQPLTCITLQTMCLVVFSAFLH